MADRSLQIQIVKQRYYHSCLVACFLMILNIRDEGGSTEKELFLEGEQKSDSLYVLSVPEAVAKLLNCRIEIFVDNSYFAKLLDTKSKSKEVSIVHQKITLEFIKSLLAKSPIICHIDNHFLGDYSHSSHFVVLEKLTSKNIAIIDPRKGRRSYWKEEHLVGTIKSLRDNIKMCPLILRSNV